MTETSLDPQRVAALERLYQVADLFAQELQEDCACMPQTLLREFNRALDTVDAAPSPDPQPRLREGGEEVGGLTAEEWKIIADQRDKVIDKMEADRAEARAAIREAAGYFMDYGHRAHETIPCPKCKWLTLPAVLAALAEKET